MTFTHNQGKNVITINSEKDFPLASGGFINFEDNITYEIGGSVNITSPISLGANNTLQSAGGFDSSSLTCTFVGSAMITGVDVNFSCENVKIGSANTDKVFDISSTTPDTFLFVLRRTTFLTSKAIGSFHNLGGINVEQVDASLCTSGFTVSGAGTIFSPREVSIGINATGVGVDLTDSVYPTINITNNVYISLASGSTAIKGLPDSGNVPAGQLGQIDSCEFLNGITNITDGIFSDDTRWRITNSPPLSDSTIKGTLFFSGSVLTTTMATAVPTRINAIWSTTGVNERLCIGDKVTFDNTTNTLTSVDGLIDASGGTAFTNNLTSAETIELRSGGGLPTGLAENTIYYAGDIVGSTFRLYSDPSLTTLVTFTTNGTEPNYYLHETGSSASGWFVYVAERDATISIKSWASIEKASGAAAQRRLVLMKTNASNTVSEQRNGSTVEAKSGIALSSVIFELLNLQQYEGFLVYLENPVDAISNTVQDSVIVANIA